MPLVFVHGVSTRDSADYQARVRKHQSMLGGLALRGLAAEPHIFNPYWGGVGARPAWMVRPLPSGSGYEAFGADDPTDELALEVAPVVGGRDPLLTLARTDFVAAVDLLWVLLPVEHRRRGRRASARRRLRTPRRTQTRPGWRR